MKKRCHVIVTLILCLALLAACGAQKPDETQMPTEATEERENTLPVTEVTETTAPAAEIPETQAPTEGKNYMEIDTPYAVLHYPSRWEGMVRVEQTSGDVYTVAFFGTVEGRGEQRLFDILFGGSEGFEIGKIAVDGDAVSVHMVTYDPQTDESWSEGEILELRGMREDVQYIISGLSDLVADFESSFFTIETPYVNLCYPIVWEECVKVVHTEGEPYCVKFYALLEGREDQPVFELIFGGTEGDCLGYILCEGEMIELNIVSYAIEMTDQWTDDEISVVYGMKDDVNYIIASLVETGLFQYPEE